MAHFYRTLLVILLAVSANMSFAESAKNNLHEQCNKKQLDECVNLAIYIRDDLESPVQAVDYAQYACDNGNLKGCNVLANLYLNEYSGLGMDFERAKALYQRACNGGYQNACTNLKNLDKEAEEYRQSHSRETRLQKLQRSCVMENQFACEALQREMSKQKR